MAFLLKFLIILFLVGFLFSRILPLVMRLWVKRMQKRFGGGSPENHRPPHAAPQKKRINPSEGDYIDFEEIV